MHACVRACRVRVAPKCKHGHVLRGNTCRAVPVKINHAPLGGEGASRKKEREKDREEDRRWKKFEKKVEVRDPCQLVLFCLVPSKRMKKIEEKDCAG